MTGERQTSDPTILMHRSLFRSTCAFVFWMGLLTGVMVGLAAGVGAGWVTRPW